MRCQRICSAVRALFVSGLSCGVLLRAAARGGCMASFLSSFGSRAARPALRSRTTFLSLFLRERSRASIRERRACDSRSRAAFPG